MMGAAIVAAWAPLSGSVSSMSTSRRQRQLHRQADRSHALEPGPSSEPPQASEPRPSRSARKRRALALQQLGVRLTRLRPSQLQQLALPEQLLAAVLEAQQLRSRAALARQRQYIGKLMRALDPEPIERALGNGVGPSSANDKLR